MDIRDQTPILLTDIWRFSNPADFKLHFARHNGETEPLDAWTRDWSEWVWWQQYWPSRNDFNRPLIFSVMRFYHEADCWLFGGVFHVRERLPDRYVVELSEEGRGFIGRLKLRLAWRQRGTRVNFENHFSDFEVQEILPRPFTGRSFPGYDAIELSFGELETLIRNDRADWKAALESVKGVYLITDQKTGKRYVGAAYGADGVWSRWCSYIATGHGGNVGLRALVTDPSLEYCRSAFRFALLEAHFLKTSDETIIARETFWKQVLLSKGQTGLNRN